MEWTMAIYHYDVMGGKDRQYLQGNIMFLCFHVAKVHESIGFQAFSPFNVHFPPKNDVMVNGPLV